MNKALFFVIFSILGALSYGWWSNRQTIIDHRQIEIANFIAKGKRFTAKDGQSLCERIADLEKFAKMNPKPCDYDK